MYYFHSQGFNSISLKKYVKTIIMGVLLIFPCGVGGGAVFARLFVLFFSFWVQLLINEVTKFGPFIFVCEHTTGYKITQIQGINDRIKCSVMLPFQISRNKRNGSIAFFEMTRKGYFLLTLSKKPIYLVILKETRQLVLPCNEPQQQFNPLWSFILDSVNNGEALGAGSL